MRSAIAFLVISSLLGSAYAATIVKPGNYHNLPQAQLVPQALGASLAITSANSYLGDDGWISTAGSSATVTITDGNGFMLAQGWVIPANSTLNLFTYGGAYFPGGFTITCSGGGCAAANVYVSWYLAG